MNILAPTLCSQLAVQQMRKRGVDDGHIITLNRSLFLPSCNLDTSSALAIFIEIYHICVTIDITDGHCLLQVLAYHHKDCNQTFSQACVQVLNLDVLSLKYKKLDALDALTLGADHLTSMKF